MAWNYSVTTGSTTSFSQALAVDNIVVKFGEGGTTPNPDPVDEVAPTVASTSPAANAINVSVNTPLQATFSENVFATEGGVLNIEASNKTEPTSISTTDTDKVQINGAVVTLNYALEAGVRYRIGFSAGAFKDAAGNAMATRSNEEWSFTVQSADVPVATEYTENFDECQPDKGVVLSGNWRHYSVTGDETWACTQYGNNNSFGVQMSGYNGSAKLNEDWLISPAYNTQGFAIPVMSIDYRTKFDGLGLQLKVSTNYEAGDPTAATWTDLIILPANNADIWQNLEQVNLNAYKSANTRIAFVYSSNSTAGAARWTLDNFALQSLDLAANIDLDFGSVAAGAISEAKTFTFATAAGLAQDVTLTAPSGFELSKDGETYATTLSYTAAEAANTQTVYVRFAPASAAVFNGKVSFVSGSELNKEVGSLRGSSISYANTLDVATWNMEWFGSSSNGPGDETLQYNNAKKLLQGMGADIIALQEVVDMNLANQLATELGYKLEEMQEGTNGSQRVAYMYNPDVVTVKKEKVLLAKLYADIKAGTATLADYPGNASLLWASGRLPYLVQFEASINGVKQTLNLVNIHAKANSTGNDAPQDYNRRKYDLKVLKDTLDAEYGNTNLILLGDFNDDVDRSVVTGIEESSYASFVNDEGYVALTYDLSVAGAYNYSYGSFLDHIMMTDELKEEYVANSIMIRQDFLSSIDNFYTTTSDHLPLMASFVLDVEPMASFAEATATKGEDAATFTVTINLNEAVTEEQTVMVRLAKNSTASAADFTVAGMQNGNLAISLPANATSASFDVTLVNDTDVEGTEEAIFELYAEANLAVAAANGTYTLVIEDNDNTTGIADATKGQFSVYPNPVTDFVHLTLPERVAKLQNIGLVLYDINGRVLFTVKGSQQNVQQVLNGELNTLKSGLYILKVDAGKEVFVSRMLKN